MGGEWSKTRLADLCDQVDYGHTASAVETPVGPKFLRITDIVSGPIDWQRVPYCPIDRRAAERSRLLPGDIVIARTGATTGHSAYIANPPDAVFASYLIRLRVGQRADPRFVSYFLKSPAYSTYVHGVLGDKSAQPNASAKTLTEVHMAVPPIAEQRAIACILGALDDKIELNRKMNQTLEGIARAIFKSWFVDFDPVRTKSEGRDPGLPAEIADLFPSSFVDSELGPIPEGWAIKTMGDFLCLDKGLSYKGEYVSASGMPMVNLGCFNGAGQSDWSALKHYVGKFKPQHCVHPGQLVLANTDITQRRLILGSPAIVPTISGGGELLFTHHVYAVRFYADSEDWTLFFYFAMLGQRFRERATGSATGTTVLALPRDAVLRCPLVAPPIGLRDSFNAVAWSVLRRQWHGQAYCRTLASLRDTLLPKLISGELRVPDAERIVGRCV